MDRYILIARYSSIIAVLSLFLIFSSLLRYNCGPSLYSRIEFGQQAPWTWSSPAIYQRFRFLEETDSFTLRVFFRHATSERNSSYPFISGNTFRAMAHHVFDETTKLSMWPDRASKISRGDIVFLSADHKMMRSFFTNRTFNRVQHSFVLVTHNSDDLAPSNEHQWVLNDPRVLSWFASNPDFTHTKLFPIPIGLANTRWPHGNLTAVKHALYEDRKPFAQRTTLLYINFKVENNRIARSKALSWALRHPNVKQENDSSYDSYLKQMGNAKFVLSPPGNGLDCHRTWEAIMMGAVPIVLRSRLDPLFSNAAVLVVDDWSYLTIEYLESLDYQPTLTEKLFAEYWYQRLILSSRRMLQFDRIK